MNLFTHVNATTLAEATTATATAGTQVIAGGTDLVPYLRAMCSPNPPTKLVNLKTITPSMVYIKEDSGFLKVGALTTLSAIAADATTLSKYTALAQAALAAASPELRNQGTIGGNICQKPRCPYYRFENDDFKCLRKDPAGTCFALTGTNTYHSIFGTVIGCVAPVPSDIAPVLVAMNANIVTTVKTWKAADFFVVPNVPDARREQINALAAGEIVTEIQIPTPASGSKSAYVKWSFRKAIDFPLVSVAALTTQVAGLVTVSSIALGGVYGQPKVATTAQTAMVGQAVNATSATAAGTAAATGTTVLPNPTGTNSNSYKVQVLKVMVQKALLATA
jgi:xanthine dehydrogenase YagS FAD-binding subunit